MVSNAADFLHIGQDIVLVANQVIGHALKTHVAEMRRRLKAKLVILPARANQAHDLVPLVFQVIQLLDFSLNGLVIGVLPLVDFLDFSLDFLVKGILLFIQVIQAVLGLLVVGVFQLVNGVNLVLNGFDNIFALPITHLVIQCGLRIIDSLLIRRPDKALVAVVDTYGAVSLRLSQSIFQLGQLDSTVFLVVGIL